MGKRVNKNLWIFKVTIHLFYFSHLEIQLMTCENQTNPNCCFSEPFCSLCSHWQLGLTWSSSSFPTPSFFPVFPCLFLLVYLDLVLSTQQYLLLQSPLMFTDQAQQDVIMVLKFPSNSPVTHVAANTQPGLAAPAVITVTANRLFAINKWHSLPGK